MKTKKKTKRSWKNEKNSSTSSSDSETNLEKNEEHDLTNYAGNSIKLMTEIFKILGDKKLKKMTPPILKPIDMNDLKACLVEESMALSKKRVISILNGETYTSSSSDSEDDILKQESKTKDKQDIDVISLDCISDDSDICCFDDLPEAEVLTEIKQENLDDKKDKKKNKKLKKHKRTPETKKTGEKSTLSVADEKAMTALELLELQARARAIKSQLALESVTSPIDNVDEEIKNETKKESENETSQSTTKEPTKTQTKTTTKKVKLRRDHLRIDPNRTTTNTNKIKSPEETIVVSISNETSQEICTEKNSEIKKERRSSSESIILESPSHPLIVISSEDEDGNKKKKTQNQTKTIEEDSTKFTEMESSLVEQKLCESPNEISSQEEGEICSDQEINKNAHTERNKNNITKNIDGNNKNVEEIEIQSKSCENPEQENVESENNKEKKKDEVVSNIAEEDRTNQESIELTNNKVDDKIDNESSLTTQSESETVKEKTESIAPTIETNTEIDKNKSRLEDTNEKLKSKKKKDSDRRSKTANEKEKQSESSAQQNSTQKRDSVDQDFIVIDSEPEFDSEPDDSNSKDPILHEREERPVDDVSDDSNTTWKDRWLDSKKVKTVLQTSKLCNNMKRKISLKKDQENKSQSPTPTNMKDKQLEPSDEISKEKEGSVEQFNSISSTK